MSFIVIKHPDAYATIGFNGWSATIDSPGIVSMCIIKFKF